MKRLLISGLLLAASTLSAWDPCCWDGDFEVGVEALIWENLYCPQDQARLINGATNENRIFSNRGSYGWGVRVFGEYSKSCTFARLTYTWFETPTTTNVFNPEPDNEDIFLFTQIGIQFTQDQQELEPMNCTQRHVRHDWKYQNLDLRLGRHFCQGCCGSLSGFASARWVDFRIATPIDVARDTRTDPVTITGIKGFGFGVQGVALGVGIGGRHLLCNCLEIFGEAQVLGIIGSRNFENVTVAFDGPNNPGEEEITVPFFFPKESNIIPEFDARVGLSYTYNCGCWGVTAEVGFELNYLLDAAAAFYSVPEDFSDINAIEFARQCRNVGFGGPFFGASVTF